MEPQPDSLHALDQQFMRYAIEQANTCGREVSPNPPVGAVLVAGGRVIGEGHTQADGGAHAEVMAVRSVAEADRGLVRGATLYVTLEPCSIHGRTPPCAPMLAREGVARVVVAEIDVTPGVCGRGLEILRTAGIAVTVGVGQREAQSVNRFRRVFAQRGRPYVILKQARSADGFVGRRGRRVAITSPAANAVSHSWRAEVDAILVGAGTVAADDPSLTARLAAGSSPLPIVFDPGARAPRQSRLLTDPPAGRTLWATQSESLHAALTSDPDTRVEHLLLTRDAVGSLLSQLAARRIGRLLVEGGPATLRRFVAARAYDEFRQWESSAPLAPDGRAEESGHAPGTPIPAISPVGLLAERRRAGTDRLSVYRRVDYCLPDDPADAS